MPRKLHKHMHTRLGSYNVNIFFLLKKAFLISKQKKKRNKDKKLAEKGDQCGYLV